ncbi:MAG: DUF485 domain-containing protein [Pseudomonadota bacterium]
MDNARAHALMESDRYRTLAGKRRRVAVGLTLFNIAVYLVYVLMMGYARPLMSTTVGDTAMNVGLLVTIGLVVMAPLISGYYIWWANRAYDPNLKALIAEAELGEQGS